MKDPENSISIGIIDDHEIVRHGLAQLLAAMKINVGIQYNNGLNFLRDLQEGSAESVDIYLIDYSMPQKNGVEVIKRASDLQPHLKFIMLTQHLSDELKIEAYEAGARAFLNKTCTATELRQTIEAVAKHGFHNFEEILRLMRNKQTVDEVRSDPAVELTEKELLFLELVCNSGEFTYQQIADRMNLSVKTIDVYRANLFEKLGVRSKVGLVLYSFNHKLTMPFKE